MPSAKQDLKVPIINVQQKLQLAVYALALGNGSAQQRLMRAWDEQLSHVEPGDFPEYLRQSFVELHGEICSIAPVTLDASEWERVIPEEKAQQLASKVFILSEVTTELFNIDHYKDSLTL